MTANQTKILAGITVGELLELPELSGARLLAGGEGLGRSVEYIDILESWEGRRWLKPKDFLMTTGFPILHDPKAMAELVDTLCDMGVSALGIKTGRYLDAVPVYMCEAADRVGLPLIELPADLAYAEIISAVSRQIISKQACLLQKSLEISRMFSALVDGGGSLHDITACLARTTGCAAVLETVGLHVLSFAESGAAGLGERGLLADNSAIKRRFRLGGQGQLPTEVTLLRGEHADLLMAPVSIGERRLGFLSLIGGGVHDQLSTLTLQNATLFAALTMVALQTSWEKEQQMQHTVLNDLLYGVPCGNDRVANWMARINWPEGACIVSIVQVRRRDGASADDRETLQALVLATDHLADDAMLLLQKERLVLVHPLDAGCTPGLIESCRSYFAVLLRKLEERFPDLNLMIGVGDPCDGLRQISVSYRQAARSLEICQRMGQGGGISCYADLALHNILLEHPNQHALQDFARAHLGPLWNPDVFKFDALETLEAYLDTGCSLEKAALRLYAHKNTVKYRIAKIKEVLGSMEEARYLCMLQLAILIRKLIPLTPS